MKIDKKTINKVRNMRLQLDRNGKPISLKKIKSETKLSMRKIKYILYERNRQRVKELSAERVRQFNLRTRGKSPLAIP